MSRTDTPTTREALVLEHACELFEHFDLVLARRVLSRYRTVNAARSFLTQLAAIARGEDPPTTEDTPA